jgi:hypothetical protein
LLDERAGGGNNDSARWTTRFFELRASGVVAGAAGGASASAALNAPHRSVYLAFWADEAASRVATPKGVVVIDGTSALERVVRTGAARHGAQSEDQRAIALRHATRAGSIELFAHSESESAAWWSKLSRAIAGFAGDSASEAGARENADSAQEVDAEEEEEEEETSDGDDEEEEEEEEKEEESDAEALEVMAEEDEEEDESVSSDSTDDASPTASKNAPPHFRESDTVLQRGDEAMHALATKRAAVAVEERTPGPARPPLSGKGVDGSTVSGDEGDSNGVRDAVALVFHITGYTRTSEVTITMSRRERASTSIRALVDRLAADVHVRCFPQQRPRRFVCLRAFHAESR